LVRETTRDQIVEAAVLLGYRPHMGARGLQTGRTATVGVITADLGNTFVAPIIHGIVATIEPSGFMPMIAETQDDSDRFARIIDHMLARRVDVMIVIAARSGDLELLESAARIVPVVIAGRPLEGSLLPHVTHDDRGGGRMAASHLAALGHRSVAQLRGPGDVANFPRRTEGFRAVVEEGGLDDLSMHDEADSPTIEEGHRLMSVLLARPTRPTAVFAHNDLMALGARAALNGAGLRVPGDISLVGYNDLPTMEQLVPPLTTVRYPSQEIGELAGSNALALLAGERPKDVDLEPRLVIRGSTAPPGR
jgi:LacI family transcriptional regulator